MREKLRAKRYAERQLQTCSTEPDSKPPISRKSAGRKANQSATELFSLSLRNARIEYEKVPAHVLEELEQWVTRPGTQISGFVEAVLMGDIYMMATRATDAELLALPQIVKWLRRRAPDGSYGSPAALHTWLRDSKTFYRAGKAG